MSKRAFLIILDSFGIGNAKDAEKFGDLGSDTLSAISQSQYFSMPTMQQMGFFNIDGVSCGTKTNNPTASFAQMQEASQGKDTTIGHWELAGIISEKALPVFPNGFPQDFITQYSKATGKQILCNMPYSGTQVLQDFGEQSIAQDAFIVYTSADSVFQVAAHEDIVPIEKLYKYCEIARDMLVGELAVGRVIARPFIGKDKNTFTRTSCRHDYSLPPPQKTILDILCEKGFDTIGVGKIYDIFAGQGICQTLKTVSNQDGMDKTIKIAQTDFAGLCFTNLVDFDMVYGHRNDVDGYAKSATEFDKNLQQLLPFLQKDDILVITADHGCDPSTPSTDHSRECVPLLIYGENIKKGINLGTLPSFTAVADILADYFGVEYKTNSIPNIYTKIKNKYL